MDKERKPIPKKIRFEVFKRDKFTCQYCGRSAPDVILEIDHINPVSKGGSNDIMNLVTSCKECNRGKGTRELSDDTVVKKQQEQIQELAEKNEQLEMMLKWRDGLINVKNKEVEAIANYFKDKTNGRYLFNENGEKSAKKWLREFSVIEILDAMDIAFDQYYEETEVSASYVIDKISGICHNRKNGQTRQQYWYHYLNKSCLNRYSYMDYSDRLRIVVFTHMKSEDDFNIARTMLYKYKDCYEYVRALEEYFT